MEVLSFKGLESWGKLLKATVGKSGKAAGWLAGSTARDGAARSPQASPLRAVGPQKGE